MVAICAASDAKLLPARLIADEPRCFAPLGRALEMILCVERVFSICCAMLPPVVCEVSSGRSLEPIVNDAAIVAIHAANRMMGVLIIA
jgi:hypothetical protein